jgi:UDP-N-acetyl-D-mannosaminuronic acid transferase (WecB/TagA/CpsF family)
LREVDVLGIQIKDYPLKEALHKSTTFFGNGTMDIILYVSAQVFVESGGNKEKRDFLRGADLIIFGEAEVLKAAGENTKERREEIKGQVFLTDFVKRVCRAKMPVLLLSDSEETLEEMENYLKGIRENLVIANKYTYVDGVTGPEALVNDINASAAEVVISNLPFSASSTLLSQYGMMMNKDVWLALLSTASPWKQKPHTNSFLERLFYKRVFKRRVMKYNTIVEEARETEAEEEKTDTEEK